MSTMSDAGTFSISPQAPLPHLPLPARAGEPESSNFVKAEDSPVPVPVPVPDANSPALDRLEQSYSHHIDHTGVGYISLSGDGEISALHSSPFLLSTQPA